MRVTWCFHLLLIGLITLSGSAAAIGALGDVVPTEPAEPAPAPQTNSTAVASEAPGAHDTQDTPVVLNDLPAAIAATDLLPEVAAQAPGHSDWHEQRASSGHSSHADDPSDEAESDPGRDDDADGGPTVLPDIPVPLRPLPLLEPPAVPVFAAPRLAWQLDEPAAPSAALANPQPGPAPAPMATSASPEEARSPMLAVAVAGVALALVAGSGVAATSGWSTRPLAWLRRVLALPFYARVTKDQVLEHGTRQELLDRLRTMPGACYAELQSASGVSLNTIRHHLRVLQANGLVTSVKNGRRRCFFPVEVGWSAESRTAAAAVSARAPRRVFRVIEARPGIKQQELAAALGVTPTSIAFHARRLQDAGIVRAEREGRAMVYYPAAAAP